MLLLQVAVCLKRSLRLTQITIGPRFLRIFQIRDPNAVCPVPALLKCDLMCPVSGATLNVDLPSPERTLIRYWPVLLESE